MEPREIFVIAVECTQSIFNKLHKEIQDREIPVYLVNNNIDFSKYTGLAELEADLRNV